MTAVTSVLQRESAPRRALFERERRRPEAGQELTKEQLIHKNQELEIRISELTRRVDALTQSTVIRQVNSDALGKQIDKQSDKAEEHQRKIRLIKEDLGCGSIVLLIVAIAFLIIIVGFTLYRYL